MPGGKILRTYDSDSSIFAEVRNPNLAENSFNEQMLEKNKIAYLQGGNAKRVNSNERIHRPRSSKGNRGSMMLNGFFSNQQ
jgi:hypothetical protein